MEKLTITKTISDLYSAIKGDKLTKAGRYALDCVRLNCTRMLSTNGHFLLSFPKPEGTPSNVSIRVDRAKLQNDESAELVKTGMNRDGHFEYVSSNCVAVVTDYQFPETDVITNQLDKGKRIRIGLNADYLERIAKALNEGQVDRRLHVVLDINTEDMGAPIKVTSDNRTDDAFGVIVPVRVS